VTHDTYEAYRPKWAHQLIRQVAAHHATAQADHVQFVILLRPLRSGNSSWIRAACTPGDTVSCYGGSTLLPQIARSRSIVPLPMAMVKPAMVATIPIRIMFPLPVVITSPPAGRIGRGINPRCCCVFLHARQLVSRQPSRGCSWLELLGLPCRGRLPGISKI